MSCGTISLTIPKLKNMEGGLVNHNVNPNVNPYVNLHVKAFLIGQFRATA